MIDVPVRVKDALRDGNLHKEYQITVRSFHEVITYSDVYTFNSTSDVCNIPRIGVFEWYVEGAHGLVGYYSIIKTDETTIAGDVTVGTTIECGYGDTVTITSMSVASIQLREKITDSESQVDFVINNNNLVSESVKIDERMCTGNQLKFGLCEGSSLEFQYFGYPNINNKQLEVNAKIEYRDSNGDAAWYTIPMGYYIVDQCPMQFNTGIYKVVAYNKLRSKYLDQKANALIADAFKDLGAGKTVKFYDLRRLLLNDYEIDYSDGSSPLAYTTSGKIAMCSSLSCKIKAKYGIDTPLSWLQFNGSDLSTIPALYIQSSATELSVSLDSTKSYTLKYVKDIISHERNIYNIIIDLANKSFNVSGSSFVSNMMTAHTDTKYGHNYAGWSDFFGIELSKQNGQTEKYSTVGYNNNATGITGTFEDLSYMTITDANQIKIHLPWAIIIFHANEESTYHFCQFKFVDGPIDYAYYTDSSLQNRKSGQYGVCYLNSDEMVKLTDYDDFIEVCEVDLSEADLIDIDPFSLSDITLRDALTAVYELEACYGKLDRVTDLFAPVELNYSRLVPADTLYPNDALYPGGNSLRSDASMYQKLWTDSQGVQTFRYLIITYKTIEDNKEVEKTLQRTVNADGTTDYYMSDNWLFKNLVWTAQDVGDYADAMVLKMQNVSWFPFEMWCAGLPYIETGDELEITNSEGTYTSYVLQRQLNGIQNLQDTYIDGELDIF